VNDPVAELAALRRHIDHVAAEHLTTVEQVGNLQRDLLGLELALDRVRRRMHLLADAVDRCPFSRHGH
jgi:hypothetical protein